MSKKSDDLTRIEDLHEYLHENDEDIEHLFTANNPALETDELPPIPTDSETEEEEQLDAVYQMPTFLEEEPESLHVDENQPNIFPEFDPFENQDELSQNEHLRQDLATIESLDLTPNDLSNEHFNTTEPHSLETLSNESNEHTTVDESHHLNEIKNFNQNLASFKTQQHTYPAYSVIGSGDLTDSDMVDDLIQTIKYTYPLNPDEEKLLLTGIKSGSFLLPHMSEYQAIYLYHKIKRFPLRLKIGPSHLLLKQSEQNKAQNFIPKSLKNNHEIIFKNQDHINSSAHHLLQHFSRTNRDSIPGTKIKNYLGLVHEEILLSEKDLQRIYFNQNKEIPEGNKINERTLAHYDLSSIHESLLQKCQEKAVKNMANSLLNVSYQYQEVQISNQRYWQLSCHANMALIELSQEVPENNGIDL